MEILVFSVFLVGLAEGVFVHKATVGETAILPCPSDDKMHRFQYWQLKNDEIVGPWNNDQNVKFRYEVWSGRLIIRSVSETESGFYKCFSKHILGSQLRSETVELLVEKYWDDSMTIDYTKKKYSIIIGVLGFIIVVILIVIGVLLFFIKRRRMTIFSDSREASPDELIPPNDSSVYKTTNISLLKPSSSRKKSSDGILENAVVETDISTSFSLPN